jgi:hypothetical protein
VQQYTQPISYGITSYELKQWLSVAFVQDSIRVNDDLTLDARPALRPPDADRRDQQLRAARRLRLASGGDRALSIRGGYGDVLHADPRQRARQRSLTGGSTALTTYTATPGQTRLPDLPDRALPAAAVRSEDAAAVAAAGARHHDPAGSATSTSAVREYGLNFDLLPNYPDEFVNPRSQVTSIGAEREIMKGCSPAPTTCTSTGPTSIARST